MLFTPERRTVNRYTRKEIPVSDSHIKSILKWLTDRDLEILRLLVKEPYLSVSQIEMMLFNDLKPSSWRSKTNDRLRRLYQANCIDRWFPYVEQNAGSSQAHYILDNAGARVLGIKLGYNPKQFKFRKRNYIPQNYKHYLKIMDFKALLHVLNRQLGVIDGGTVGEIILYDTEQLKKFHYTMDNKVHEGRLIPDTFCAYKYNAIGNTKFFFAEFDNATEPMETVKNKLLNYRRYFASGEWRNEKWARLTSFPAIVFVFHHQEQVDEMVAYSRRLNSSLKFLFTTYDKLYVDDIKIYHKPSGKKYKVVQNRNVRILDSIWSSKDGLVSL